MTQKFNNYSYIIVKYKANVFCKTQRPLFSIHCEQKIGGLLREKNTPASTMLFIKTVKQEFQTFNKFFRL